MNLFLTVFSIEKTSWKLQHIFRHVSKLSFLFFIFSIFRNMIDSENVNVKNRPARNALKNQVFGKFGISN